MRLKGKEGAGVRSGIKRVKGYGKKGEGVRGKEGMGRNKEASGVRSGVKRENSFGVQVANQGCGDHTFSDKSKEEILLLTLTPLSLSLHTVKRASGNPLHKAGYSQG